MNFLQTARVEAEVMNRDQLVREIARLDRRIAQTPAGGRTDALEQGREIYRQALAQRFPTAKTFPCPKCGRPVVDQHNVGPHLCPGCSYHSVMGESARD